MRKDLSTYLNTYLNTYLSTYLSTILFSSSYLDIQMYVVIDMHMRYRLTNLLNDMNDIRFIKRMIWNNQSRHQRRSRQTEIKSELYYFSMTLKCSTTEKVTEGHTEKVLVSNYKNILKLFLN